MDGIMDGGSPRRGSLSSLHRQSSGSLSHHHSRLNISPSTSNGSQGTSSANSNNLYKDLDKFTRYFIIKTIQVIVQSRINGNKRLKTECKPNGNDWFNINITDIAEVSEQTKAALDCDGLSVRSNWRVCCEISLKTHEEGRVILEHWIISNKANSNANQNHLATKLNSLISLKAQQANNRTSPTHHLSSSNGGISHFNANPVTPTTSRVRHATFSNTVRSRLNSIDDCSGDDDTFNVNKLSTGLNNENIDIKSSTSCYSLSSAPVSHAIDPTAGTTTTITTSPSINSLTNNLTHSPANNATSQQQGSKTSSMSSIYTIYNRMSLLLKTLMTTTHIVPAYRLASKAPQADSCVICYRVYACPSMQQTSKTKGSDEDVNCHSNFDSPSKRSPSNLSLGSVNIREFVGPDELDYFCPILKLGSIKTEVNELEVALSYRTDIKNSSHLMRSPIARNKYSKILDEDCITAAKQLLAGNDYSQNQNTCNKNTPSETIPTQEGSQDGPLNLMDRPLRPAFATIEPKSDQDHQDPDLTIIESAFEVLLQTKKSNGNSTSNGIDKQVSDTPSKTSNQGRVNNAQSEPIQVPCGSLRSRQVELCHNRSAGSTPKSLSDSFVFVDINPPFASEEQNDISSFFHGPSPAFNNGFDSLKDVDELTNQLANIEANASQIDEFVDNICVTEDEDEED